jgi:hypothetical protein
MGVIRKAKKLKRVAKGPSGLAKSRKLGAKTKPMKIPRHEMIARDVHPEPSSGGKLKRHELIARTVHEGQNDAQRKLAHDASARRRKKALPKAPKLPGGSRMLRRLNNGNMNGGLMGPGFGGPGLFGLGHGRKKKGKKGHYSYAKIPGGPAMKAVAHLDKPMKIKPAKKIKMKPPMKQPKPVQNATFGPLKSAQTKRPKFANRR